VEAHGLSLHLLARPGMYCCIIVAVVSASAGSSISLKWACTFLSTTATTNYIVSMEEAHRASQTYHNGSSMSARQVADSLPVQDQIEAPRSSPSSSSASKPRVQGYAGSISLDSPRLNEPSVYASKTLPLSIPAILKQNVPGFKARNARMAQLQQHSSSRSSGADDRHAAAKGSQKHLGRRKQRRWENGEYLSL
jgi:hypothetical protein